MDRDVSRQCSADVAERIDCNDGTRMAAVAESFPLDPTPRYANQWALKHCGFDQVWATLDTGHDPGPIGLLDIGALPRHPQLANHVVRYVSPGGAAPSPAAHAGAIAAIISASRDGSGQEPMAGCCSALLHIYSIANSSGPDRQGYYEALRAAGEDRLRVVNMSYESSEPDATADRIIQQCADDGTIFVAAMGNDAATTHRVNVLAKHPAVIAVGATGGPDDLRWPRSNTGRHIFISAPGRRIWTIDPIKGYRFQHGTSYAAPMVSAAIWLALRQRPHWGATEIRRLLSQSVARPGAIHTPELGYGRLDVVQMKRLLDQGACD